MTGRPALANPPASGSIRRTMHPRQFALFAALGLAATSTPAADLRFGLVGLDTSHCVRFTEILNNPAHKDHVRGARVTGAFKDVSPLVDVSAKRAEEGWAKLADEFGVRMYPSIEALAKDVDVVLILSADGHAHVAQARPAILAGKPVFIDKPMTASVKDAVEIFRLAREHRVPIFSSSSLRFAAVTQAVRNGSIGRVLRAETSSPASLEPHHPDLFWYGIHGVESLFTVMGTGLESVTRLSAGGEPIVSEGRWQDGRTGIYR